MGQSAHRCPCNEKFLVGALVLMGLAQPTPHPFPKKSAHADNVLLHLWSKLSIKFDNRNDWQKLQFTPWVPVGEGDTPPFPSSAYHSPVPSLPSSPITHNHPSSLQTISTISFLIPPLKPSYRAAAHATSCQGQRGRQGVKMSNRA
jgi:hypothetical protein